MPGPPYSLRSRSPHKQNVPPCQIDSFPSVVEAHLKHSLGFVKHSAISRSCVLSHSVPWLISHPDIPSLSFLNCKCSNVVVWLWLLALQGGMRFCFSTVEFSHYSSVAWNQPMGLGGGWGVKWALFSVPGVFLVSGKHTCSQPHTCTQTTELLRGQIRRGLWFPVSFWLHHLVVPGHFQPVGDIFCIPTSHLSRILFC